MTNIIDWINPKYLKKSKVTQLRTKYLLAKPFPYLELKEFFKEDQAIKLVQAIAQERFFEKESDLFKFMQSNDFNSSTNKTIIDFVTLLKSKEFIDFMNKVTKVTCKQNKVDIHATLYQDADYLLCHDDQLDSRIFALNFYLSDLKKEDGGALTLLDSKNNKPTKVSKRLIPSFNSLAFFKVSKKSFHAVEEVLKEKQRITLGAWLHK